MEWRILQANRLVQISTARGIFIYKSYLNLQSQIQQILFVIEFYLYICCVLSIFIYIFISENSSYLLDFDQFIYIWIWYLLPWPTSYADCLLDICFPGGIICSRFSVVSWRMMIEENDKVRWKWREKCGNGIFTWGEKLISWKKGGWGWTKEYTIIIRCCSVGWTHY